MTEWAEARLGEMLRQASRAVKVAEIEDVPFAGARWYAGGIYARPVEEASKVKTKVLNRLVHGDITYNRMWATKAAFGVAGADVDGCLVTNDFPIFLADRARLLPEYLRVVFQTATFQSEAAARAVGTTERRRLKEPAFLGITIPLPPLVEQRRIVDVLSAVDAQIAALMAETWRLASAYVAFLKRISESHEMMTIESIVKRAFAGGTPSRDRVDFYGGDIPWLKSGEVENDHIETSGEFITEAGLKISSAKMVPAGATVVAMYGKGDTKGKAGYVAAPVTTNQAVLALIPDERVVTPRYLMHAVRSQTDALRARATGAAQPNLSKGLVLAHEIPVPKALDEQRIIADAADAMSEEKARLTDELTDFRSFRSALLTALIDREIAIPESYDDLLGEVS